MRAGSRALWLSLAGASAAIGCGGMEGELLEELRVKEKSELCVQPQMLGVDAFEANDGKRYVAKAGDFSFMGSAGAVNALDALKAKGYAGDQATSLPRNFASTFDAFEITEKGSEYFRPDAFGTGIEACIGERAVTEIIDYTEPGDGGSRKPPRRGSATRSASTTSWTTSRSRTPCGARWLAPGLARASQRTSRPTMAGASSSPAGNEEAGSSPAHQRTTVRPIVSRDSMRSSSAGRSR